MTNILSAISGQFSKSILLGTFFPIVVFMVLSILFVVPIFPPEWLVLNPIRALSTEWKVILTSFLAILLTGVLYNLNVPIIRFYEGYPWAKSFLGKRRITHYKTEFDTLNARWTGLRTLLLGMDKADPRRDPIETKRTELGEILSLQFPGDGDVLPTRLGNVIASFEYYPNQHYGIDGVEMWPRLLGKIDKDYASVIDDSKTSFDFMINSSLLFAILALCILVGKLLFPTGLIPIWMWGTSDPWLWILKVLVFASLAYFFYRESIGRASAWGEVVKGAFDLYRWGLLEQLGYKQAPTTKKEEEALWDGISTLMIFGTQPGTRGPDYKGPPPVSVSSEPSNVKLELTRGVSAVAFDGTLTIRFRVRNVDANDSAATETVISDIIPDGFDYEWGSAYVSIGSVHVAGTNPYRFNIGTIPSQGEVLLTYRAITRINAHQRFVLYSYPGKVT